jgi:hypothetical protein
MAELADLSLIEFPAKNEGPTPCFAVVLQITAGKTNNSGQAQYMGAMRHKDPRLCTMSALAQYFFWRWEISGEEPLDFQSQQSWYGKKAPCWRGQMEGH